MGFIETMGLIYEFVTIKDCNGKIIKDKVKAIIPKNLITMNADVNIEENNIIERILPNGHCEKYKIIDIGFVNGMGHFINHYQTEVKKIINEDKSKHSKENIINNISCGENAKININSNDNSINIQNINNNNDILFKEIENTIKKSRIQNKEEILLSINEMKKNIGTSSFKEKYLNFISSLSSHVTIITPFLPALSKLLSL